MITRLYALIRVPRFRTTEARHATWMELFYDLAFVVAVATLGHELSHDLTPWGVAEFAVLFSLLWWSWAGYTFYASRFDTDDLIHRVMTLLHMGAICLIAVFSEDWLKGHFLGFFLSYLTLRLLIIGNYAAVFIFEPQARPLAARYMLGFLIGVMFLALSTLAEHSVVRLGIIVLSLCSDMLTMVLARFFEKDVPLDPEHIPERFGLFTILILGETLVAGVRTVHDAHLDLTVLRGLIFGLIIAFSIWWMYFVNLSDGPLRRIATSAYVWIYAHLPLMMSLVLIAVGLESSIGPYTLADQSGPFLLFSGFVLALIFLALIDGVSVLESGVNRPLIYVNIAVKFIVALVLEWWFLHTNMLLPVGTIARVSLLVLLVDIYCNAEPKKS